ncbi:hypothetical protein FGRMN_2161 [Fusarium graminum]|nr:hypothetical protein FGRMN_2161 [Fusarium graminum]
MSHLSMSSARMDQLVDHFRGEVDRVSVNGVNGEDQVVPYVSLPALKKYWTRKRVNDILNCPVTPITEDADMIVEKYLRIFSTLAYNGCCDRISWFIQTNTNLDDHNLPFDAQVFQRTSGWSNSFLEHQWMFCPAYFAERRYYKRPFDSKVILPVTYAGSIRERRNAPDGAILRKYKLNLQSESTAAKENMVVFKVYEGHEGEFRYKAETDVYLKLDKKHDDRIVKHIANFFFRGTHKFVIVLEYAEGGSLTDYLAMTHLPMTPEDISTFWKQLLELLDALHILSMIYQQISAQQQTLVGVHQDIHPGNVLVFPKVDGHSPFDVTFKLTDFGLAEMGRVSPSDQKLTTGNRGNRMYVAPEVFQNFPIQDRCDVAISPKADIWSLGALFSDVLIWTIGGEAQREKYRLKRLAEISNHSHLRCAGYDCMFHDGEHRLKSVDDVHEEVLKHRRASDWTSSLISEIILDRMLVGPLERADAMQIRSYAARKLEENRKGSLAAQVSLNGIFPAPVPAKIGTHDPWRSPTRSPAGRRAIMPASTLSGYPLPQGGMMLYPLTAEPSQTGQAIGNFQENGTSASWNRAITVDELYPMIAEKNRGLIGRLFGASPNKADEIMNLRGMQEARSKISENDGRDQIFLLDDFESMRTHRQKAMKTARVISYVAKEADNDDMEVYAASRVAKGPITCRNSTEVETVIGKFKTVHGTCNLRQCLDKILNRVLKKNCFKPTSIYIFTDGIWELGDDHVKFAISRAIKFLIEHQLPSSALMFQFVQFGSDPLGEARMKSLDNECKKETEYER